MSSVASRGTGRLDAEVPWRCALRARERALALGLVEAA